MQPEPNPLESSGRWWLAVAGRPDGPRTLAYVSAALQAGQLSPITPVCPEGGCEWRPLATWPALAALTAPTIIPPPPLPPTSGNAPTAMALTQRAGANEHLLTNAALPPIANLICIYTILVVPLYWMFGLASLFTTDNPFLDDSGYYLAYGVDLFLHELVTLALTVVLAVGGVRLRNLRTSGERLVRLGLSLSLIWVAFQWLVLIALSIMAGVAEGFDEGTSDTTFLDVFGGFISTAAVAWDIVSLVWLFRHRFQLPLHPHT